MNLPVIPPTAADERAANEKVWYEQGLRFTCTTCGNCCTGGPGYVWVTDEEVDRLAAHLGLSRSRRRWTGTAGGCTARSA